MTALTCPHCSQIDQVGKVSAIVSAGTQSGTQHSVGRSAGYALLGHHNGGPIATVSRTQTHSTTQSVLAQRLSLAPQPAYVTATDPIMAPGLGAVAFFVLALLSSAANIGMAIMFGLACIGLGYIACRPATRRESKARLAQADATNAAYRDKWQRALMLWPQLYYCARCDMVFFPGALRGYPVGNNLGYLEFVDSGAAA